MRKNFLYSILFAVVILLGTIQFACSEEFANNTLEIHKKLTNGHSVYLKILKNEISKDFPYKEALMLGGDITEMPNNVITNIIIYIEGKRIFVPLSAFSDLGDPISATLENVNNGFKITILGGSTAGAYKAILFFDLEDIRQKKVMSLEFPNQVWEKIKYSFISPNSKM